MVQRDGQVRIVMLPNVQQKTIKPFIEQTISKGTLIYTDEYAIYSRLDEWGYSHKTVNHSAGEYARDEDGDGFHEVHVNKMERKNLTIVHGSSDLRAKPYASQN